MREASDLEILSCFSQKHIRISFASDIAYMSNQMKNCLLRSNPIDTSRSSSRSSIDEVDSDLRRNRVFSLKRLSGVQDAVVTGKIGLFMCTFMLCVRNLINYSRLNGTAEQNYRLTENILLTVQRKKILQFPSLRYDFLLLTDAGSFFKYRIPGILGAEYRILGRKNRDYRVPGKPFPSPY